MQFIGKSYVWPMTGRPRTSLMEPPGTERAMSVVSNAAEKLPIPISFSNNILGTAHILGPQATQGGSDGGHKGPEG